MKNSTYLNIIYYLLSIFLAFGANIPLFGSDLMGNLGVYLLCTIIFIDTLLKGYLWSIIIKFRINFILLILVLIVLFFSGFLYGVQNAVEAYFNYKFLSIIFFYCIFSYHFNKDKKLLVNSILLYSISLSFIALFTQLGFLGSAAVVEKGRLILFNENPNSYSIRAVLALFSMLFLIFENPLNWSSKRFILLMFFPSLIYLVIASGSRGSFIIFIFGLILFSLFLPISTKRKITLLFMMLTGILCIGAYILNDEYLYERLIISTSQGQLAGRGDIWSKALKVFDENFLLGVGEFGYLREMHLRYNEARDAHNLFVYLLTCSGIIGFVLFVCFLVNLLFQSVRKINKSVFPFALLVALIILMSKTGGVLTYLVMWYFLSITTALSFRNIKGVSSFK